MREQISYLVRIWDGAGIPSQERWMALREDALDFARSTARHQSCTTTVFYDGFVIARFDHRQGAARPRAAGDREMRP